MSFVLGLYDNADPGNAAAIAESRLFGTKFTHYLNYIFGTFDNVIKAGPGLGDAKGWAVSVVANLKHRYGDIPSEKLQFIEDPAFRRRWATTPHAAGVYLADEPRLQDMAFVEESYRRLKPDCPNLPFFTVLYQTGHGWEDWIARDIGDWIGVDPYVLGTGAEDSSTGPVGANFGYANFAVAEGAALVAKHALAAGKVPMGVLQMFQFGTASRLPTDDELWAHAIMCIVEGVRGLWWWARGTRGGALDTSPPADRDRVWGTVTEIVDTLRAHESALVAPPRPDFLAQSSTPAEALAWRLGALERYLAVWPALEENRPVWWFKQYQHFAKELAGLRAGNRDASSMLGQAGPVRTRVLPTDGGYLVFAYNHQPDPIDTVLRSAVPVLGVEDLVTGEWMRVADDAWPVSFGGASSRRQGSHPPAHLYWVTVAPDVPPPPPPPPDVLPERLRIVSIGGVKLNGDLIVEIARDAG